jgi:glucosamine--fructose-6-phosphate aminotransferase (isomerizing)
MALSRTGRTSETLEAARKAIELKMPTIAITSDPTSTIGKECDYCVDINTESEQSTVMTKTFTASALCSILVGVEFARRCGAIIPDKFEADLGRLPKDAEEVVRTTEDQAREIASKSIGMLRFIYLGSGASFATCLEGALKVRETSQSASETYHPMELRHGPFAELEKGIQVFGIVPNNRSVRQAAQLLKEIALTGSSVIPLSDVSEIINSYPDSIRMPDVTSSQLASLLFAIPLQLFAYYYSVKKGLNPDRPRNLTRYVTTQIGP